MYITLPKGFESKKQLKRTKNFFMIYKGDKLEVYGYSNARFKLYINDSKSQSRYIFTLNGDDFIDLQSHTFIFFYILMITKKKEHRLIICLVENKF